MTSTGFQKSKVIRIPRFFYDDSEWRDRLVPESIKRTKRHVWIDLYDEHLGDLVMDADYHAYYTPDGIEHGHATAIRNSSRATLKAISLHATWDRKRTLYEYAGGSIWSDDLDWNTFRINEDDSEARHYDEHRAEFLDK
jgi:hypothetical protein